MEVNLNKYKFIIFLQGAFYFDNNINADIRNSNFTN